MDNVGSNNPFDSPGAGNSPLPLQSPLPTPASVAPVGSVAPQAPVQPQAPTVPRSPYASRRALIIFVATLLLLGGIGLAGWNISMVNNNVQPVRNSSTASPETAVSDFDTTRLTLGDLPFVASLQGTASGARLLINGEVQISDGLVLKPSNEQPASPKVGEIYYSQSTNQPYYFDGSGFVSIKPLPASSYVSSIGSLTGTVALGAGLQIANGQLASTLQPGISSVSGTAKQVLVASSGGGIVLSLPQDLDSSASPTFAGLTLTSPLTLANGGNGSSTAAGARTNLGAAASGANSDITSTTALDTITPSGSLTVGATGQSFTLQGNSSSTMTASDGGNTTTVGFATPTANVRFNFPAVSAGAYDICVSSGNCGGGGGTSVTSLDGLVGALTIANSSGAGSTITIDNASASAKGIAQFNSTNFSVSSGTVNTIQNIATSSSPTFAGLTLTGALGVASGGTGLATLTTNGILYGNGASAIQVTAAAANSILVTNGSSVPSLSQTLPTAVQGNITGTGALASGSIASGFGTISTGNNITTTATAQGATVNATTAIQLGGANINTAGTLTNVAYLNQSQSFTGANTFSRNGSGTGDATLLVTGTPVNNATSSQIRIGNAIASGNNATDGGTYIGLNAPASGAGSAADFLNFQQNSTSNFKVTGAGALTAAGTITFGALNNVGVVQTNGSGVLSTSSLNLQTGPVTGTLQIGNGGTGATSASAARSNLGAAASGANGDITSTTALNTITPSGSLTVGSTSQAFTLQGNGSSKFTATDSGKTTTLDFATPTADVTLHLPALSTGTYTVCTTSGNCSGAGGGVTTPGGTANRVAKFTASQTLGDSTISDDGSTVTLSGAEVIQGSSGLTIGVASTTTAKLAFKNSTNGNTLTLQSGATGSNLTLTLPTADGSNQQCLATNGSGVLAFQNCLTGSGSGGGVSSLDGLSGALTIANSSGTGSTVTIDDASTSAKGIAQFDSTNFSVSSGTVNTIQNIATTSSPSFSALTVTKSLSGAGDAALLATGTPTNNATSSLVRIGNAIASGNTVTDGGTYIGLNAPSSGAGSAADFINFQQNGSTKFKVSGSGDVSIGGTTVLTSGLVLQSVTADTSILTTGVLSTSRGGTGAGTFTANGIIYGNGTGALQVTSAAANSVLVTNGSNVPSLSQTLPTAVQGNITSTGALASGSIASGFGTISTGNNITTTATVQGGTVNGTSAIQLNGTSINTAGTLTNVAYLNQSQSFTGANTFSRNGTGTGDATLLITGTPVNNATSSQIRIGNAIAGGNTATDGGTYVGLNAPSSGAGSAADFLNFQQNGTSNFKVTGAGALTAASTITFSSLNSVGVVQTNGSGVLSTSNLNLQSGPITGTLQIGNGGTGATTAATARSNLSAAASGTNADITSTTALNTITPSGALTVGSLSQSFTLQGNASSTLAADSSGNTTTIGFTTPTADTTLNFPALSAGSYTLCTTSGNCAGSGGGVTTAGGTTNTIAKFTGAQTIGDSSITDNGSTVTITGTANITTAIQLNGANINTAGTLSNVAYLNNTTQTFTGINTLSRNGSGAGDATLAVTGAPINNATSSLIRIGSSIASGNNATDGGTYIGLNAPNTGAGSAADFLNFQQNGSSKFKVAGAGDISVAGTTVLTSGLVLQNVTADTSILTTGTLSVARGGTGAGTFTANGILYGNGTSALQVTSAAANSVLVTNGSNVPSLSQTLPTAVQGNITSTGALASGSIASGFGTISTGNNITTTATVQGGTVNGTSAIQLNGTSINTAGTLTNVAYLNQANTFTNTNLIKPSSNSTTAFQVQNSSGTTVLNVDTTNRWVGIGTTSPQSPLHVNGGSITTPWSITYQHYESAWGSNATRPYLDKGWDATQGDYLYLGATGNGANTAEMAMVFAQNQGIKFGTGTNNGDGLNSELMRLTTGGNLGIGLTPTYKLDVSGDINTSGALRIGGTSINTGGTLSNVAYLDQNQIFTGTNTFSRNGSGAGDATLAVTGAPVNNATSSLLRVGNSITSGNTATNGGTYIGLNAPSSGAGSAADFLNFQQNGTSNFKVTGAGSVTAATSFMAPLFDTASAATLNIGTTNATGITLQKAVTIAANQNFTYASGNGTFDQSASSGAHATGTGAVSLNGVTTVASNKAFNALGSALFKDATNSTTAFQVQNASSTTVFNVDTTNQRVGIGTASPNTTLEVGGQTYIDNKYGIQLTFNENGSQWGHFYGYDNGLYFGASSGLTTTPSSPIMTWDFTSNNVGVKTTTPTNALTVAGKIDGSGASGGIDTSQNLLPNAGLDTWASATAPYDWQSADTDNWNTGTHVNRESTTVYSYPYSAKLGDGSNTGKGMAMTNNFRVIPGDSYMFSAKIAGGDSTAQYILLAKAYQSDGSTELTTGTPLGSQFSYSATYGAWYFIGTPGTTSFVDALARLNLTTSVYYLRLSVQYYTGGASSKYVYVDDVNLSHGTLAPAFAYKALQDTGNQTLQSDLYVRGNVGIGTTSPSNKLYVLGSTSTPLAVDTSNGQSYMQFRSSSGVSRGYFGYDNEGTGGLGFLDSSGNTTNMLLTNAGNLGIGTSSPGYPLHITKAANDLAYFQSTGANKALIHLDASGGSQQAYIGFNDAGNQKWQLGKNVDQGFFLWDSVGGRNGMYIASNGNMALMPDAGSIGVGTYGPGYKLDVQGGDINTSGAYRIGGTSINTAGTLSNVAYLNQANTFTSTNLFQPSSNSTTAFRVQDASAGAVFDVDTTNKRVGIGLNNPGYTLGVNTVGSSSSSPATIGFENVASGRYYRFAGGCCDGLQGGNGQRDQLYGYWGIELRGNTLDTNPPTYVAGTGSDAGVAVINTTAANKALVVQGASSQSGNLQEWQNSSGTALSAIDSAGKLGIGTGSPVNNLTVKGDGTGVAQIGQACTYGGSNYVGITLGQTTNTAGGCAAYNLLSAPDDQNLYLNVPSGKSIKFRSNNNSTGMNFTGEPSGADSALLLMDGSLTDASSYQAGLYSAPTIAPGSASSQEYIGVKSSPYSSSSNLASGTITGLYGGVYWQGASGQTLQTAYGLHTQLYTATSGVNLTNAIGAFIQNPDVSGGGNITNDIGIRIENQTRGGTSNANLVLGSAPASGNYSIYSTSANQSYLAGNLGLGVTSPGYKLDVNGTFRVTGAMLASGPAVFSDSTASRSAFRVEGPGVTYLNYNAADNSFANNTTSNPGNLLENGDFESTTTESDGYGANGWGMYMGTITNNATNAHTGNRYMSLTADGNNNDIMTIKHYRVTPGDKIYAEGWVNTASASGNGGYWVHFADKDNATIEWDSVGGSYPAAPTSWTKVSGVITAPSNAATMDMAATIRSGTTGTWRFDDAMLRKITSNAPQIVNTTTNSTTAFQVQNASYATALDVDTTNLRVGVGTTTPSHSLDVIGGDYTARIGRSTSDTATAPTTIASSTYLQVGGQEYGTDSYRLIGFGWRNPAGTNTPAYIGYQEKSISGSTYGDLLFGTRSVTTDTAATERMRITNGGNVGIGTASPNQKLEIAGSGTAGALRLAKTDATTNNWDLGYLSGSTNLILQPTTNASLAIKNAAGSTNQLLLDTSTGNTTFNGTVTGATLSATNDSSSTPGVSIGSTGGTNYLSVSGGRAMFGYDTSGQYAVVNAGTTKGFEVLVDGTNGTFLSGTASLVVSPTGTTTLKNASNSTTAFQIQNTSAEVLTNYSTSDNSIINNGISNPGNLLENGGFEAAVTDADSGTYASGWGVTANGDILTNSSNAHTGNRYVSVTADGGFRDTETAKRYRVIPGDVIYAEGWINTVSSANGTGGFWVRFIDKDGSTVSYSIVGGSYSAAPTSWTKASGTITVPSSSAYMTMGATVRDTSTTGTWRFDDMFLQKITTNSPWIVRPTADTTTVFQVQNAAASTTVLTVDTTNSRVGIGTASPSNPLHINVDSSSTADLQLGGGTNVSNFLAVSGSRAMFGYDASANNLVINGGSSKGIDMYVNGTSGFLSGSKIASINTTGSTYFKTSTDATTAFQVKDSTDTAIFDVDTSNNRAGINTAAPTTKLDVNGLIRVRNPQGETSAPTRANNGEFAFANVSSTQRLYFRANGTDSFINGSGSGDYSEFFLKQNPGEVMKSGQIVTLDSGKAAKTSQTAVPLGVVSAFGTRNNDDTHDGQRGDDPNYANIGILGQLPVIVSSENGPIASGAMISNESAYPGVGTKNSASSKYIVGRAIQVFNPSDATCPAVSSIDAIVWPADQENYNPENLCFKLPNGTYIGKIMAYVNITWNSATATGGGDINQDTTIASGKSLTFAAGTGNFDQSASNGLFATGTGSVYLNGNTTVADNKSFTAGGTALFKNAANSTAALRIQDSQGTDLLVADTTNLKITVKELLVAGNLTVDGHIITGGDSPIITTGPAACTNSTATITGNDTAGSISLTTGINCATPGKLTTITFHAAFGTTPEIVITPGNAATSTLPAYIDKTTLSPTSFDINTSSPTTNNTTYEWFYHVLQ